MAEKKLRRASNSSLNLRVHMNDNYVVVNDVSSSVGFEKYLQFARGSFDNAVRLFRKKDYQRAYVDFTKFTKFAQEKLPAHQGFSKERSEKAKVWLNQAVESAMQFIEEISFQLDVLEDQRQNPDSRAGFLMEMQSHDVDIYVPEWIKEDSDDEDQAQSRAHNGTAHTLTQNHFPNQQYGHHFPGELRHSHSQATPAAPHPHLPVEYAAPSLQHQYSAPVYVASPRGGSGAQQSAGYHLQVPQGAGYVSQSPRAGHAPVVVPQSPHGAHVYAPPSYVASSPHAHPPHSPGVHSHFHDATAHSLAYHATAYANPHEHSRSVLPGVSQDDASILQYYRAYTTFDIPPPTVGECEIRIKQNPQHSYRFQQHDFHLSYAPFLKALPAELQMTRSAVEVNRCFFIHLGVATQFHPFALQTYFRFTAASERDEEEDWERELAKTLLQYSGCVDANILQYTWSVNFDKYRILLISGPADDPLLTCFVPSNRTRALEDLYEIVIRNDRDHYTLLRPMENLTTKIKVIDRMLAEAKQLRAVCQVCPAASRPAHNIDNVLGML